MEGSNVAPPATVSDMTDSSAEQSLEVGCFAFSRQVRPHGCFGRRVARREVVPSFGW
jgi:hypothetical protein